MENVSAKDDVTSLPVRRSKEYLAALVALGGNLDAVEEKRLAHDDLAGHSLHVSDDHGSGAWGGPRHLRSNWGARFNGHGRCRRTDHANSDS